MFQRRDTPPPFSCSEPGSFAEHTLLVRLPEIARRVIEENDFSDWINRRIAALIEEMPEGRIRLFNDPDAPDLDYWAIHLAPWLGMPWRELSFLACEMIFYRRVLEATRYFQPGDTYLVDPYGLQKQLGYNASRLGVKELVQRLGQWREASTRIEDALYETMDANLWANRADLSIWPASEDSPEAFPNRLHQADEYLLANDLEQAVQWMCSGDGARKEIHFLIDNAGFELIHDLALADVLLTRQLAGRVVFHVKAHPMFVSDAIEGDVVQTVLKLCGEAEREVSDFGRRLEDYLAGNRLHVMSDFFWSAPLPCWDMPAHLESLFSKSWLVISKGDANYRRLTGDCHWPEDTSFREVVDYFPAPVLALRVAKSEVMVGLQPGQASLLSARDPAWKTNGRWGLIQFRG